MGEVRLLLLLNQFRQCDTQNGVFFLYIAKVKSSNNFRRGRVQKEVHGPPAFCHGKSTRILTKSCTFMYCTVFNP